MAYALESSKRKFHRLLESVTDYDGTKSQASANVDNGSTTSVTLPAEKRRRLALPQRRISPSAAKIAAMRLQTSTQTTTTQKEKPATMVSHEDVENALINWSYAPASREDLIRRLATYQIVRGSWSSKPEAINEVQWARGGWVCVGKETVRCVSCRAREIIPYAKEEEICDKAADGSSEFDEVTRSKLLKTMEERCASLIVDGHSDGCFWRRKSCSATLYRIKFVPLTPLLHEIKQATQRLSAMPTKLPERIIFSGQLETPPYLEQAKFVLKSLATSGSPSELVIDNAFEKAYSLTSFGWCSDQSRPDMLRCESCFRTLGLWQYRSTTTTSGESRPPTYDALDVAGEHRSYCPWVDGIIGTDNAPAWHTLSSAIRRRYDQSKTNDHSETLLESGNSPIGSINDAASTRRNEESGSSAGGQHDTMSIEEQNKKQRTLLQKVDNVKRFLSSIRKK